MRDMTKPLPTTPTRPNHTVCGVSQELTRAEFTTTTLSDKMGTATGQRGANLPRAH